MPIIRDQRTWNLGFGVASRAYRKERNVTNAKGFISNFWAESGVVAGVILTPVSVRSPGGSQTVRCDIGRRNKTNLTSNYRQCSSGLYCFKWKSFTYMAVSCKVVGAADLYRRYDKIWNYTADALTHPC